jgi:hypothetical protein
MLLDICYSRGCTGIPRLLRGLDSFSHMRVTCSFVLLFLLLVERRDRMSGCGVFFVSTAVDSSYKNEDRNVGLRVVDLKSELRLARVVLRGTNIGDCDL